MSRIAKLFSNGRSQAVRLPAEFRFSSKEVYIRKDQNTGDVILSSKPNDWDEFFSLIRGTGIPCGFLDDKERHQEQVARDPFADWRE